MAVFKCKSCGADLKITDSDLNKTVIECDHCFSNQTLPKLLDSDEKLRKLYKITKLRIDNEFDQAIKKSEQLLEIDDTDSELYWALVLAKYGVEYVDDGEYRRVPTIVRLRDTSLIEDADYKDALKYASTAQKIEIEKDAKIIDDLYQKIIEIMKNEPPYDVFISFKNTDENGNETEDARIAQEIYYTLKDLGYNVFFSKVSLKNVLGSEYEPHIFAAVNTAKVMLVIGTTKENYESRWVKNEWKRFLFNVKESKGRKKLVCCYKNMNPKDLPKKIGSHLQAANIDDLLFGSTVLDMIKKAVKNDETPNTQKAGSSRQNDDVSIKIERMLMLVKEDRYEEAYKHCDLALDLDPKNDKALLYRILTKLHFQDEEQLLTLAEPFESMIEFRTAIEKGSTALQEKLIGYNNAIIERIRKKKEEDDERIRIEKERHDYETFCVRDVENKMRSCSDYDDTDIFDVLNEKTDIKRPLNYNYDSKGMSFVKNVKKYSDPINCVDLIKKDIDCTKNKLVGLGDYKPLTKQKAVRVFASLLIPTTILFQASFVFFMIFYFDRSFMALYLLLSTIAFALFGVMFIVFTILTLALDHDNVAKFLINIVTAGFYSIPLSVDKLKSSIHKLDLNKIQFNQIKVANKTIDLNNKLLTSLEHITKIDDL